jgi:hypothetical protein
MNYSYLKGFYKTTVDDMAVVQKVLKETNSVLDAKLFPHIEEAENGNFEMMAELYEMFVHGQNDIKPNYALAKYYSKKIHAISVTENPPEAIAESLKMIAMMHYKFGELELASEAFLECFTYYVTNLAVSEWDSEVIKLVADNLEDYQDTD